MMFDNADFLSSLFLVFTREYRAYETEEFAVRADQIVAFTKGKELFGPDPIF